MGGYGALKCALTAPQQYAGAAGFSSVADIKAKLPTFSRWHEDQALFSGGVVLRRTICLRWQRVLPMARKKGRMPEVFLACGQQDGLFADNLRLRDHLRGMDWPLTWYEAPGDHNWFFWNDALTRAMEHFLG